MRFSSPFPYMQLQIFCQVVFLGEEFLYSLASLSMKRKQQSPARQAYDNILLLHGWGQKCGDVYSSDVLFTSLSHLLTFGETSNFIFWSVFNNLLGILKGILSLVWKSFRLGIFFDHISYLQTFTAWVNSHLRKAGTQIENIEEDFR